MDKPTTKIIVNFTKCEAGWIDFNVQTEDGTTVEVNASHVFDPFPSMIKWLEAILIGVPECAFIIDEEGTDKDFRVRCNWPETQHFILSDGIDTEFIHAITNSMQLVHSFYTALHEFAQSPKYKPDEWQFEMLGDRLIRCCKDKNKSLDQIVDDLANYDADELRAIFWRVDPSYSVHPIQAKNEIDAFQQAIDYFLDPDKTEIKKNIIKMPEYYPIPEEYNLWNTLKKKDFIEECMNDHVNHWDGCRLADIRSSLIEERLKNYKDKI